jgi:small subunit ribosomal protein S6
VSNYELIFIVHPNVSDEELPGEITKVSDLVAKLGGNTSEVTQWGRKKLAYPIKKVNEGSYVLAKIDLNPTKIEEFDSSLKMSGSILRHLLVNPNN